ncbi:rubrerythrin family protein [Thermococcus celer Vu 13 = JCM 8558]|uniref:Rubrerythrin family protein n=2 Tax=Thermococcus celer TaxID=2264 RepID=A0A218P106_THECE|nr:rubrerythrin family protein [Thermococcus celer Vu 13 = JCM 8558]
MVEPLVKKAYEIEKKAAASYTDGLGLIRGQGLRYTKVEEGVGRIAVDTVIHKHLMQAILEAQKELEKLAGEGAVSELKEVELTPEQRALVKRFAEMHLEIEKDMIKTYQKMAEKMTHPLFKGIAEALVENEREHHRILAELIAKYKE